MVVVVVVTTVIRLLGTGSNSRSKLADEWKDMDLPLGEMDKEEAYTLATKASLLDDEAFTRCLMADLPYQQLKAELSASDSAAGN